MRTAVDVDSKSDHLSSSIFLQIKKACSTKAKDNAALATTGWHGCELYDTAKKNCSFDYHLSHGVYYWSHLWKHKKKEDLKKKEDFFEVGSFLFYKKKICTKQTNNR